MTEENVSGPSELRESAQLKDSDNDDDDGSIIGKCIFIPFRCAAELAVLCC